MDIFSGIYCFYHAYGVHYIWYGCVPLPWLQCKVMQTDFASQFVSCAVHAIQKLIYIKSIYMWKFNNGIRQYMSVTVWTMIFAVVADHSPIEDYHSITNKKYSSTQYTHYVSIAKLFASFIMYKAWLLYLQQNSASFCAYDVMSVDRSHFPSQWWFIF